MKTRPDSHRTAAALAAFANAAAAIAPPTPLDAAVVPYFNDIVHARPRDSWTAADLTLAVTLARCRAETERVGLELSSKGPTVVDRHGELKVSPLFPIHDGLIRQGIALARVLQVTTVNTTGRIRDRAAAIVLENEARSVVSADNPLMPRRVRADRDSLIPGLDSDPAAVPKRKAGGRW